MTTPFQRDVVHASYDPGAVGRYLQVLQWTADVFEEFAGWFNGKTCPVHLFWYSFDLAPRASRAAPHRPFLVLIRSPPRPTGTRW